MEGRLIRVYSTGGWAVSTASLWPQSERPRKARMKSFSMPKYASKEGSKNSKWLRVERRSLQL